MCEEKQEVAVATKICKCCGKELPINEFAEHGRSKDGHKYVCKACEAIAKAKKFNGNPRLSSFTPRELMKELNARGYAGTLIYVERHVIDINKI